MPEGEVVSLSDVKAINLVRVSTGIKGVDDLLGTNTETGTQGIAIDAGHVIQIYGTGGGGKSTLLLQVCRALTQQRLTVLYFAGEEGLEQIKDRANRIGKFNSRMRVCRSTSLDDLLDKIEEEQPRICVVDSLQTIEVDEYATGAPIAVQTAARELHALAKANRIAMFFVVQITKGGDFAGAKTLEHLVDTSIFVKLEHDTVRTLRCESKNRFGAVPKVVWFDMRAEGLVEIPPEDESSVTVTRAVAEDEDEDGDEPADLPARSVSTVKTERVLPVDTDKILSVSCSVEGCKGNTGRACTSSSGVREAGFHDSRIAKARELRADTGKAEASPPTKKAENGKRARSKSDTKAPIARKRESKREPAGKGAGGARSGAPDKQAGRGRGDAKASRAPTKKKPKQ